ncbi:unnamed protein product [Rotaria socialis]|uniref:Uncharacterized protein n=1 Tax=Rotaria socialis TaxID=392032 RepID=A0A820PEG9_9BILA|nr:unnamed protein product [Rotaria socialis]CAF4403470.1 unnamed protein product [Rotaria socialis]
MSIVKGVTYRRKHNVGSPSCDLCGDFIVDYSIAISGCTVNAPTRNTGMYASVIRTIKTTDENSSEWAKDHLPSEYYAMIKSTEVLDPLVPYRRAIDERKFVESLGNEWPQNYILLGDTLCTFNPQYRRDISYIFNRRASPISEGCWLVSTANHWKTSTLKMIKTDQNGKVQIYERDNDSTTTTNSTDSKLQASLMIRFFRVVQFLVSSMCIEIRTNVNRFLRVINQHSSPHLAY